jgi:hypothetical protein
MINDQYLQKLILIKSEIAFFKETGKSFFWVLDSLYLNNEWYEWYWRGGMVPYPIHAFFLLNIEFFLFFYFWSSYKHV